MKWVLILFITGLTIDSPTPEVRVAGALRKIMQEGDLSAHLSLDTLLTRPHIYGLGPAEGIRGELMILDSKAYWCRMEEGRAITSLHNAGKAAMLVYAAVPAWKNIRVTEKAGSYTALEKLVEQYASQHGQPLDKPFPFLIRSRDARVSYHVIDWKEGVKHTAENHKQFAGPGKSSGQPLLLLGFYSNRHHGVFTHHSSNMHIHVMDEKKSFVGHLDEFMLNGKGFTLEIPGK